MPIYSSDSDDYSQLDHHHHQRLFGHDKPLHSLLGGGKVADIMLWKKKYVSAAILAGFTTIWLLFEVVEYHLVPLLCHLIILSMLVVFVWTNVARLLKRSPPDIRQIMISEYTYRSLYKRINWLLHKLCDFCCGDDLKGFFLTITCLWMLSVAGNYMSSLNLVYIVFLKAMIIPVLYERYEKEVDYIATRGSRDMKKAYKKLETRVLNKIPRAPVKERKRM